MSKPTVFVSYRRQPSIDLARYVHDKIVSWGIDVFLDLEGLSGGEKFSAKIQKEIINRDVFLIILTPETLQSEWVVKEVNIALEHDKLIIPLVTNNFDFYRNIPDSISKLGEYNAIKYDPQHPEIAFGEIKNILGVRQTLPIIPIISVIVVVLLAIVGITALMLNSQPKIPEIAPIVTNTVEPAEGEGGFPCEGIIVTQGEAQTIRVVRSSPSATASIRAPIEVGITVIVQERSGTVINDIWYSIVETDGGMLGWIPAANLVLSNTCPE